jgi:hypothetical protein
MNKHISTGGGGGTGGRFAVLIPSDAPIEINGKSATGATTATRLVSPGGAP